MDDGKKVWVPHPVDGFKLGRIIDIGAEEVTVEVLERPAGQKLSAPFDCVYPADDNEKKDVDDNCKKRIVWYSLMQKFVIIVRIISILVE